MVIPTPRAFAVSPLVVDDAETVERGRLQLNAGLHLRRTAPVILHTVSANPVFGLSARSELGATFGYQWRHAPQEAGADGITDLMLATKWRLWQTAAGACKVSTRFDLKLPTASERRGLGTEGVDVGAALIATRCWRRTCLDWNAGYTAVDASRSVFGDDLYSLGLAARQAWTERWTLVGETYAVLPHARRGSPAAVHLDGGAQFTVRDLVLSMLVGSVLGRNSPRLTGYLGFTWARR